MLGRWLQLCLVWQGALGFLVHHGTGGQCLEDSHGNQGVRLTGCMPGSELQQWRWTEPRMLQNAGTGRCLSGRRDDPPRTVACDSGGRLRWRCINRGLVSGNRWLEPRGQEGTLALSNRPGRTGWTAQDGGDVCQERPRSRRQSGPREAELTVPRASAKEQEEFLRWFYRSEDPTPWVFAMLSLSFLALLFGCVLIVMGVMGNRSRRAVAKYKASTAAMATVATAAVATAAVAWTKPETMEEEEELQVLARLPEEDNSAETPPPGPWTDGDVSDPGPGSPENRDDENVHQ